MDASEQIRKFEEFFDQVYKKKILSSAVKGKKSVVVDFREVLGYDTKLAEEVLNNPEEGVKAAEIALEAIELPTETKNFKVRFDKLPETQKIMINEIRSEHLGKLLTISGIVRQKSDVRPQVTESKFECPNCGNVIKVLQIENAFREPDKCGCGRRGKFRLIDKFLVDAQAMVLEESPDELDGGEQPKRLNVFLKEDLVSPISEKRTNPGSRIVVVGALKEVPVFVKGTKSTRFDLVLEANYTEAVAEDFYQIEISKDEEKKILELSQDPKVYEKLVASVIPAIHGYDKIKEALLLQLLGGVHKKRSDGTNSRGDCHILLVGDPGAGKCLHPQTKIVCRNGEIATIEDIAKWNKGEVISDESVKPAVPLEVIALDERGKICRKSATVIWKRKAPKRLLRITTGSGNEIVVTKNHPFFVTENGLIHSREAKQLTALDFIATPRMIRVDGSIQSVKATNGKPSHNSRILTVPDFFDEDLARLFGYLVGDGYVSYSKTSGWVSLTNNNAKMLNDFKSILERKWNARVKHRASHVGKTASEYYVTSKQLVSMLQEIEPSILFKSAGKRLPSIINKSPIIILKNFLQALYECEGSVNVNKGTIEITSASRDLISDLKLALLRFGIIGFVNKKTKWASNTINKTRRHYLELVLYGINVDAFAREIGFLSEQKQDLLSKALAKGIKRNTNTDIVPNIGNLLRALRSNAGLLQKEMGVPRTTYMHYERGDRNISMGSLRRVIANCDKLAQRFGVGLKLLQEMSQADVFWDSIEQIEEIDSDADYVYDLQVEDTHNYVANAIVVHNSQMLKRISSIAPKGRYVAGKGASGAGLTAAVVKDEFLGGWSLEAGALVLSNNGLVAIDEMDKMTEEDRGAMHEALEQQSISIAKANIQATLSSKTTVLAAANPKFGRFDPHGIIAEQIDMPPTLINRFDLIFPIKDLPDAVNDEKLASHILEMHRSPDLGETVVPTSLLKKYVAYARQKCNPKLTDVAIEEIKNFYVQMRNRETNDDRAARSIPISARQLEALVRLAEAHAKVRLSDKVGKKDARKAIELLMYCLLQVGLDRETGKIDIDRITTGIGASQRERIHIIREILQGLEVQVGKAIPLEDIQKMAQDKGMSPSEVEEIIERLKRSGDVFEPRYGFLSRV